MSKDYLDTFLTDREKEALTRLASDDIMIEAIRKLFLTGIYSNGVLKKGVFADPMRNTCFEIASKQGVSNEVIGEDVKAKWQGVNSIESSFVVLQEYKVEPVPPAKQAKHR